VLTVKKYPNRRLYDTEASRYITVEELAERVRAGRDVRVLDARSDEDLTQPTLVQLLVEGKRAHLLPVPLLHQLVRMGDDSLAEFFGRYMTWALEVYFAVKQRAAGSVNPFAQVPFDMAGALARLFLGQPSAAPSPSVPMTPIPEPPPSTMPVSVPAPRSSEIAELRRELAELRRSVQSGRRSAPRKRGEPSANSRAKR
jgi:polyhydroxyalkanoate synthesis repressor PhaR